MRYSTVIASALSATAVLAAPLEKRALVTSWVIEVVTDYTTVYPTSTPVPAVQPSAPVALGGFPNQHKHSSQAAPPAPTTFSTSTAVSTSISISIPPVPTTAPVVVVPTTTAAAIPAPSSGGSTTAGACSQWSQPGNLGAPVINCDVSVLDTFNKWRGWYNLGSLTWDDDLALAAWNTVYNDKGGPAMNHDLTRGSMAEIITPGFWDLSTLSSGQQSNVPSGFTPFDLAMAGWLCEKPSDPQLTASGPTGTNLCGTTGTVGKTTYVTGTDPDSPTGHHDIIVTPSYTKMGCQYMTSTSYTGSNPQWAGQWVCEFA